jgi:CBS domain-containing protein
MNVEGLTSVAVVDNGGNVVGNISIVDVKHVTTASQAHLLQSSCIHFISVILSERGMERGRDTFPVFHVSLHSTLAHTVAKLAATRSHRMWVVESASPSPTQSSTNSGSLSGKLIGIVYLTDILNVFAKSSGLNPSDPGDQRARRRRSSSISVRPKLTT